MVNRELLEKLGGYLERLDNASIINSPEAKELISRIGSSKMDELSEEGRLSARLLYGFAKYQDIVCDLVNMITALSDDGAQSSTDEAAGMIVRYQEEVKELDSKYDAQLAMEHALKMCPCSLTPQQLLEMTSDQWNELTDRINTLAEAIRRKDDVTDFSSAIVWQASLFPRVIEVKGEAAKFANRFNELIANINIENTDNPSAKVLS